MTDREEVNKNWVQKWEESQTGWHKEKPNPHLEEFFHYFGEDVQGKRILVPLCGKSVDLKWLYDRGMSVIGIDVVEMAVKGFFDDHNLDYQIGEAPVPDCKVYCHDDRLSIYLCDIFKINATTLGGPCDYLWDRGGLVAINYPEKQKYSEVINSLLSDTAQGLVECIGYDHALHPGPPYSVIKSEMLKFFSSDFSVEELCDRRQSELPEWYAIKLESLFDSANHTMYYIKR